MILLKATNESLQLTNTSGLLTPTIKNYAANYVGNQGANTTTLSVSPDSTISVGDWIIMVVTMTTVTTITTPTGWTVIQAPTTAGTLVTAIYAKNYAAGDSTYTITTSANANTGSLYIMWGSGADAISNWVIGANTLRANITPTTTFNNVAASLTTTAVNNLVFAISTERTTASESGVVSITGAKTYAYLPQTTYDIQTTLVATINQVSAGSTPTVTVVYPNTQASNGQAIQIALPPAIANLDFSVSYTEDTASTSQMSSNEGKITSLTTTTLVGAPSANSTERVIKLITVTNINPYVSASIVISKAIAGTSTLTYGVASQYNLQAGEMVQYMDGTGWKYYAANGTIRSDFTTTVSSSSQVLINKEGYITGAPGPTLLPQHVNDIPHAWSNIAMSSDGKILATTDSSYGFIWLSWDFGVTWNPNTTPILQQNWYGIYSSANGQKLLTTSGGQNAYVSTDAGVTFTVGTTLPVSTYYFYAAGVSANFRRIYVGGYGGYIYTSVNDGKTWTQTNSVSTTWSATAVSGDGNTLMALNDVGACYMSYDGGNSFTLVNTFPNVNNNFYYGCLSFNGTRGIVAGQGGYVYVTTNSGVNWTQTSLPAAPYQNVSCSFDGLKMIATSNNGYLSVSLDGGITWVTQTNLGSKTWGAAAFSGDGSVVAATVTNEYLYTFIPTGYFTWTPVTSQLLLAPQATMTLNASANDAVTPLSGTLAMYARNFASRPFLTVKSPAADVVGLQHAYWSVNPVFWTPGSNVGNWIGSNGATLGTAAVVLPTSTNAYTYMRRSTFSNVVTTTNQQVGIRSESQFLTGMNGTGGGFYFVCRFGFDAIATGCRAFVGMSSTTVIVSGDPSAVLNIVGFGFDAADTAWTFYHNGSSGTATKETIAGQSTLATANTGYDAYIWSPPNSSTIYYRLDRTDTGAVLVDSSVKTNLPVMGTYLQATAQMSNGTANTAVNTAVIGINRLYVETAR